MVTAYGREEVMQQADQVDLEGFLLKPVNSSLLFDTIMEAFGKVASQSSRAAPRIEQKVDAIKDFQGANVLLVEDNEINQQVAKEILEGAGLVVTIANNGQEALEFVTSNVYDAVLMDVQMPVMDGYAATRRIRKWESGLRQAQASQSGNTEVGSGNAEVGGRKAEGASRKVEKELKTHSSKQGEEKLKAESSKLKAEDGSQRKEGERLARWEGERKSAIPNPQSAIQVSPAANQNPIPNTQNPIPNTQYPIPNTQYPKPNTEYRTPIIAMTAHAMAGDEDKSLQAGMNGHVTKPIDPDQLFATLQNWIKPKANRAALQKPAVSIETSVEDQVISAGEILPESLPGFDLAAGLERLRGNKNLYRKLLLDFGANYSGVANEIRDALVTRDFIQAHSLVHNLKGLAGNLEATDLQAAAVKIEKLVKGKTKKTLSDSENELNRRFAALKNALERTLKAVDTISPGPTGEKKTISSSRGAMATVPPELIQRVTESIKAAVELGDVMKIKSIAEASKSESSAMAPFCDELVRLAENLDLDDIQKFVVDLDT